MKKLFIVCGLALLGLQNVFAQDEDTWVPKQLGIGVGVGTTGISVDLSTTVNRWFGVRAGVDIIPKIKVNTDLDLGFKDEASYLSAVGYNLPENIDVQGQLSSTTFHFLIDFYPFKNSSFHATTGFYTGGKEFISVYNKQDGILQDVYNWNAANPNDRFGVELGDYFIAPGKDGNMKASIEVSSFRPYLGIGFGRAVPRKSRIGFQSDFGVQFWGTPKVYTTALDSSGKSTKQQLTEDNVGGDGGDVIKIISKISVYPTLNFRLVGRIL